MPISPVTSLRTALLGAGATIAFLLASGSAAASTPVDLRVVAPTGAKLAEQTQHTGSVRIRTDRKARCFGRENRGSGKRVRVRGVTPLGAVADATKNRRALRPLSVTDAFSFGLGVCGIGGHTFDQNDTAFWYVKVNHTGLQVGADQARLEAGDEVLWFLAPTFDPLPPELELRTAARTRPGQLKVRVFEYGDDGTRSPAEGALVNGADQPTDASGRTTVELDAPGTARLRAARPADGAIPSNVERVCVDAKPSDCPKDAGRLIAGTRKRDRIDGTRGPDRIKAKGGKDRIDVRDGVVDRVNCGKGRDTVFADSTDELKRCERIRT